MAVIPQIKCYKFRLQSRINQLINYWYPDLLAEPRGVPKQHHITRFPVPVIINHRGQEEIAARLAGELLRVCHGQKRDLAAQPDVLQH